MLMKTSSAAGPLDRAKARNCILLNQLATPGLGSFMAGRRLAGAGQLLVAVAGFLMVCGWFALTAINSYNIMVNDAEPRSAAWLGKAGAFTFGAAWLWALLTSVQIHRAIEETPPPEVPPRLT
jgi:hypothetical protein